MATTTHDLKLRAILDVSQVKQQVQQLNSKNTVNLDASGINNSINALNRTITKFTTSLEKLSQSTEQTSNKLRQTGLQSVGLGAGLGKSAGLALLGMGINNVGRAALNYYRTVGDEDKATLWSMGSKVGGSAMAGFGMAGVPGAVIGAGVGGIEWWFENAADEAKKAAEKFKSVQESLEAWKLRIDAARLKDTGVRELENQMWLKEQLKTGSINALQQERGYRVNLIASRQSSIDDFRRKWGIYSPIETATTRAELLKTAAKDEKDSDRKKALEDEEKAIRASIAQYEDDIKARSRATSEIEQIESVLKQIKTAAEAEKKRIEIEDKRNEAIIKKLRQTDIEGAEYGEISNMLKGGNLQMLNKMLTSVQAKVAWAEAEYNKYLEAGDGDKATEARRQLMRYRGYESSITSGIEGLESKDISKLGDQYRSLLSQLLNLIQPSTPVAQLQAMGGSMGWVDRSTESIDNNVQKLVVLLQSISTQIRKTDISQPFILG